MRFIVAVSLLLLIAYVRRSKPPRTPEQWRLLVTTGLLAFTLNYGLIFWGEKYISSGLAALLQATIPLFGLLIAHRYLPGEPLTLKRLAGVALGLSGLAVILSNQLSIGDVWAILGSLAIVVGAFAAAYSNVLVKARATKFDLTTLIAGQMLCGLLPLLILGLIKE